jgi:alpha-L-fucosidase 2
VRGLEAYGGFEVDVTWENGRVDELVVRSTLGGNCRLRVPNPVASTDGTAIPEATGLNPNPLFETPTVQAPIISSSANLHDVTPPATYVYDLSTEAGRSYILVGE